MCTDSPIRKVVQRGLTLIELLIFIVIVGVAATAILGVFGNLTRSSASLLPDKQAQAIAASMLQEVLAQPFTFCDPNDPAAPTAAAPGGCADPETPMTSEPGETRTGPSRFDNVNDYNSGVDLPVVLPNQLPATGATALAGLPNYTYRITVAPTNALPNVAPNDALRVTVVVTGLNGATAQLQGVRIRYAPNSI
ncbi:prepilin-type N-terminal cleavage/methylation domain-containing protein [Thiobacillus sp.]|uniref:prepilin-type N-terminal cleavage/methylation domain-containing protein n=1 Tax=Thiobacillus sp. TaxID=924 RepID=UPI0025E7A83D|nr:prepilin-type N-terminal cleavage/methylation domain-containing protein [Thiobacillus sp.]MBT9540411.1 prepilin-type N-terminal cleavage/methylation domain-containing protein [Thiobacillus sp.]